MSVLGLKLQRKPHYNFIAGKLEPNVVCISIIVSYPGNKSILYRLNHIDSDEKCFITLWQPKASLLFSPLAIFKKLSIKDFLVSFWLLGTSPSVEEKSLSVLYCGVLFSPLIQVLNANVAPPTALCHNTTHPLRHGG